MLCKIHYQENKKTGHADWEKIFTKTYLIKDCYPKYKKELLNLYNKKTNNPTQRP